MDEVRLRGLQQGARRGRSRIQPQGSPARHSGPPRMSLSAAAPDLSGPGPWRLGQNRHGRGVAAVFLPKVELHTHIASRTDQFPMYVVGEAEGFSLDEKGKPVLEPVIGGSHFHNAPGAPHAFVPKVGVPKPDNWEI